MSESELYPPSRNFLINRLHAWESRIKANVPNVGEIDVLGVRSLGGELSGRSELVAIEVKESLSRFAVSVGQAHGYSVVAERCYLAVLCDGFTPLQVMIAGNLGVGLVRIWTTPTKQVRFEEVLTAPAGAPIDELRLQAIDRLGLGECSLCRACFRRSLDDPRDFKRLRRATREGSMLRAADDGKGLMWWLSDQVNVDSRMDNGDTKVRRYLCPDCVWAIGSSVEGG